MWEGCLVGQFFGFALQLTHIHVVNKLGGRNGIIDVIPFGYESSIFKFESSQTKTRVLEGGPRYIANKLVLLQRWTPGFSSGKLSLSKILLWIRLKMSLWSY